MNSMTWKQIANADSRKKWRCTICGTKAYAEDPQAVQHKCKPRGKCSHLGRELRREQCNTCAGRTEIKVLACDVHGECTIGKPIEDVACCAACDKFALSTTQVVIRDVVHEIGNGRTHPMTQRRVNDDVGIVVDC